MWHDAGNGIAHLIDPEGRSLCGAIQPGRSTYPADLGAVRHCHRCQTSIAAVAPARTIRPIPGQQPLGDQT